MKRLPPPIYPGEKTSTRALGHCQICEREYKLHNSHLVHHGYLRPGHGHIVGDCAGVNELPYELSCDVVKWYLGQQETRLNFVTAKLTRLQDPKIERFTAMLYGYEVGDKNYDTRNERRPVEQIKGQTDKFAFESRLRQAISSTAHDIEHLRSDITRLKLRITNWRLMPVKTQEEAVAQERAKKDQAQATRDEKKRAKEQLVAEKRAREADRSQKEAAAQALIKDFYLSWAPKFVALAESPKNYPTDLTGNPDRFGRPGAVPARSVLNLIDEMRKAVKKAKLKDHSKDHLWPIELDRAIWKITGWDPNATQGPFSAMNHSPVLAMLGLIDDGGNYSSFLATMGW